MNGLTIQEPKIKPLQALSTYKGYNSTLYVFEFIEGFKSSLQNTILHPLLLID